MLSGIDFWWKSPNLPLYPNVEVSLSLLSFYRSKNYFLEKLSSYINLRLVTGMAELKEEFNMAKIYRTMHNPDGSLRFPN